MADMDKVRQEQARQEQERINRIWEQIHVIDGKLQKCNQSKNTLSGYETSLNGALESWRNVNRTLHSHARYTQIVTTDVFEGEMADRLKTYMTTVVSDINTGISDTASLLNELQAQLSALEAYAGKLSAQRASLLSQL